jgi:hypothetical protein
LTLQLPELELGRTRISGEITSTEVSDHFTIDSSTAVRESPELDDYVLGSLQSKILIALLISKNGCLTSGAITKRAGISASSWAKIKNILIEMDLLSCKPKREMAEGRVIGSVEVRLTKKGVFVAQNLLVIASIIGKNPTPLESNEAIESVPAPMLVRA